VDLDQHQLVGVLGVDRFVDRLDQRALAHAARAPEQRVVGGQAGGEAPRVLEQQIALAGDAGEQREIDAADLGHGG
jgi:hypothetical protein